MVKEGSPTQASEQELKKLEVRIEEMIRTYERLKQEIVSLRKQQAGMSSERAKLIDKNDQAYKRVEQIVRRLKALEQEA
jgi:uncharacterized protein (TIGR02449 family)